MTDPTKQPGTDVYRTISVNDRLRFDIAIAAESLAVSEDSISQSLAGGVYPGEYLPLLDLVNKLTPQAGVVLDLGAHIGTFSLPVAAAGYQIIAIEASPRNAALLQTSVSLNRFDRMRVIHAAVTDRGGTLEFIPHGPWGMTSTPQLQQLFGLPTVKVPGVSVDEMLSEIRQEQVHFIKIDVEGSEIPALRGMARLLASPDAPAVYYECCGCTQMLYGKNTRELKATLEEFGYRSYLVEAGRLFPLQVNDFQPDCVTNNLAVKCLPAKLPGWKIGPPLTRKESVNRLMSTLAQVNNGVWGVREHVLSELEVGPTWLLSDKAVREALESSGINPPSVGRISLKDRLLSRLRSMVS